MAAEAIRGTVDRDGRLVAADPRLLELQEAAGARLGELLAIPQLAELARLALQLGVTLSRPALAARDDADLDLWVRVEPAKEGVSLKIEQWVERAPRGPRFARGRMEPVAAGAPATAETAETDAELRLVRVAPALAALLGLTADGAAGLPLTRLLELAADESGDLPLLAALVGRRDFAGQRAQARRGGMALVIAGEVRRDEAGEFAGYRLRIAPAGQAGPTEASAWDALLRQPLDVIVSEAEQIAGKAEGPLRSDYAAYAGDIASAARHLLDVLRAMSPEHVAGAMAERIDLAGLALEAAGLVQPKAAEAKVSLELDGDTSLPALGEGRAITQILVNLIGNAVRHSPKGAMVRITASAGAQAAVTVADQGPGVAAADRERIFERFEQAQPEGEGAGLGLAISRRLAREMGGDITLDSPPGEGARFTLRLPPA